MIQIDGKKIIIEGNFDNLIKDIGTFVELFSKNENISKLGFGIGFEEVSEILDIELLLRIIFTACSINKVEFKNLLDSIEKILEECKNDKFKLIYQERKKYENNW